jgi:hypothetical protein
MLLTSFYECDSVSCRFEEARMRGTDARSGELFS